MTPGWKTSEFWATIVGQVVGAILASGVLTEGSIWVQLLGGILAVASAFGYQAQRTSLKKAESQNALEALKLGKSQASTPSAPEAAR